VAPADLVGHACIQVRDSLTGQPIEKWQFRRKDKVVDVKIAGRLMVAEFGTMLGACVNGVGIARVKAIGVQHLIDDGALVEVLSDWAGETYLLYALYPSRHLPAAKVRAFIDFVQTRLARVDRATGGRPARVAKETRRRSSSQRRPKRVFVPSLSADGARARVLHQPNSARRTSAARLTARTSDSERAFG
jgi:LysR substrate binding domain